MVDNIRKIKKGRKRQRNRGKPSQWLWEPFLKSLRKMNRRTQVKGDGLATTVERRGTSTGITLQHLSHPRLHVWSAKDHTRRESAPRGIGFRCWTPKTIRTEGARGSPHKTLPNCTWGTPGINNCGGPICWFSFRHRDNLLYAYWRPWPTFFPICFRNGIVWMTQKTLLLLFFKLSWRLCAFFTRVSDHARVSLTHFGEGYTEEVHASFFMNMKTSLSLHLTEQNVNPRVWENLWVEHRMLFL